MLRAEKMIKQQHFEQDSEEKNSLNQECSEQGQMEEVPVGDQKIEDLHHSLQRLRQFVAGLPEEEVTTIPQCVEEYCNTLREFCVKSKEQVVLMAQRRLNKMLRNRKIKRNWNNEDITLLVWLVSKRIEKSSLTHFSQLSKEDWEFISQLISGSTWQKCKFKLLSLKKVKLVTHKWSKVQSKLLTDLIADQNKINWKLVAETLYQFNPSRNKVFRTAKQCRQHWNCFLNPNIQKGPWTILEDRRLVEYVLELQGSKKWSQISKFMEGRTENALKNRYNLLVKRQKAVSGNLTEKRLLKICLNRLILEQAQEENLELSSPLAIEAVKDRKQVLRQDNDAFKRPIVPSVVEPPIFSNHISYNPNFSNMTSFVIDPMCHQNPIYISFLFPNQFFSS